MAKVNVPHDRTDKQPVTGFCMNPECLESSDRRRFEFPVEHSSVVCPKCGANEPPYVGVLALVHLLVRDNKGPIIGTGGLRWKLLCDEKRAYLATATNQEAATGDPHAISCPGCKAKAEELGIVKPGGFELVARGIAS
jgi:Zn finger protein HypA/HybF involved in hydrogenase expression